jgi:hypothetical protein
MKPAKLLSAIKFKSTISLVALAILLSMALSTRAWLAPALNAAARPSVNDFPQYAAPLMALEGSTSQQLEAERFTIRATGFEPGEISRPAGRFLLAVENRSGLKELVLRLSNESGKLLREVRITGKQPDWNDIIDAPGGNYILTEANHPDWACRITIY